MSNGGEPVKVVIINTEYVETDATSFKSIVQELTGKDSEVTSNPPSRRSRFYHEDQINKKEQAAAGVGSASSRSGESAALMKNLSFKEFERLLKEMPPADDLWWRME
ncbi:putative Pectin lyase-like superfamily protein [Hibiscus syriacus]|uniref:Pectin lyase-like superfamily protein n=1 Tax=Hibiscus syriacus TaxID=106335 RepID=A0A6A2YP83_HIBSY|nr:VQ motif-containing protein 1-like [Hibiscus syriacus]KAE8681139.1 putative Pectin lyase-like superfamily protein [Hibiscus syriacus]